MNRSKLAPWLPGAVLILLPLFLLQCASTPQPTDGVEQKIARGVAQGWTQHLLAEDMDSAMTLVDDSFGSAAFLTRVDLENYLKIADERNFFAGGTVDFSNAVTTIKRRRATVYPVRIHAPAGSFDVGVHLTRNGKGWMVSNLDWELY